ncbi:aminotransferase class V-fold PLP-dependent enzyme [uncultured Paludibaculum sp.]|uniref:aminotransferase class V-fold PLP-dependent enzyme n=1 Tax=uncultured Paludibaculum sp. TaxID=1765020 RepID=UPI002AAC17FB|nr:aminotransferase class V-fold PLP-dependent enzyme [uncultured Paludibaculum sp.]
MVTRRKLFQNSSMMALSALGSGAARPTLPDKANFRVQEFETCLNAGRWHPLSNGARKAADLYQEYKQRGIWDRGSLGSPSNPNAHGGSQAETKQLFAKLIGASVDEIAFVQSTTAGENLVVQALGLPADGVNIVTDGLHFEGSLYLYDALRQKGMDVRVVKPRNWRLEMADLERAIDKQTRLVAISLVSYINGFEHDLRRVCEVAHAKGALVYADIVQAAGAMPFDVGASGVDFCATASYKWLMGDFGLGFLYASKGVLGRRLRRPVHSYRQLRSFSNHMFPYDSPAPSPVTWAQHETAAGYFEQGTLANSVSETLAYSLQYLETLGVETIHKHSQSMIQQMRREVPRLGHALITPEESRGPLVAFQLKDPMAIEAKLKKAKVDVTISDHRMRVSPSVYNDQADIDRLLQALSS